MESGKRVLVFLGVVITGLLGFQTFQYMHAHAVPELTTPYQAVLLSNGQAFFGKLEHLESAHPILRDVFYVRTQVNPDTQQPANTLIKRGQEWHGPEYMILNASQILVIEPVKPDSQVGKLIEEAKRH